MMTVLATVMETHVIARTATMSWNPCCVVCRVTGMTHFEEVTPV